MSPLLNDIDVQESLLTLPGFSDPVSGRWIEPQPVLRIELEITGYSAHQDIEISDPTPTKRERLDTVVLLAHRLAMTVPEGER